MNVIRNCNDKNVGCGLLELQQAGIYSRTDVYASVVISASLGLLFLVVACFYGKVDRNWI